MSGCSAATSTIKTEFVMFTLWDSMDAVKAFAGDRPEVAVYYPEDDRYLIERGEFRLALRSRRAPTRSAPTAMS